MKRSDVLGLVRVEVAKEGKVTPYATRLYIENRISRATFNAAVQLGLAQRAAYLADLNRSQEGIKNV